MKKLTYYFSLVLFSILLMQCSPSWKDANKKINDGDKKGASIILTQLAEKGDIDAIKWLANYYSECYNTLPDSLEHLVSALPWLIKTAEDKSSSYNVDWALYLVYSQSSKYKNEKEALKWASSACKKGHFPAYFVVGDNLYKSNRIDEAIPLLKKVADKKNPNAYQKQYVRDAAKDLYIIFTDSAINHLDVSNGNKYGDIAAALGDPLAQYAMAIKYTYGIGIKEDIGKAYQYMTERPGGLPDKKLEENIKILYDAEMKMRQAKQAMEQLEELADIFTNSGWIKRDNRKQYMKILLGANDQIIIERRNMYGTVKAKFRYLMNESSIDNFEPRIIIHQVIDVDGSDYSWGEEFLGNIYTFKLIGNTLKIEGDRLTGYYERL